MQKRELILIALGIFIGAVIVYLIFGHKSFGTQPNKIMRDGYGLVPNSAHNDEKHIDDVVVNNEGLFAKIGDNERVVSAGALPAGERVAGFHYAVNKTIISPNSRYLFYCVQLDPADRNCMAYIYSVETDMVYPVKNIHSSEHLTSQIAEIDVEWDVEGRLLVNGYTSTAVATPWNVQ